MTVEAWCAVGSFALGALGAYAKFVSEFATIKSMIKESRADQAQEREDNREAHAGFDRRIRRVETVRQR